MYVLKSIKNNRLYKGFTQDLNIRIRQHNDGLCQTTKSLRPLILIFAQPCKTRVEARILEKYLKSGSGREIIREISSPPW